MVAKKSCRKHGARVWMTKGQIAQKYSDKAVAEQICAAKMADEATRDSQTKPHPDLPDSEAQTGGWCFFAGDLRTTPLFLKIWSLFDA